MKYIFSIGLCLLFYCSNCQSTSQLEPLATRLINSIRSNDIEQIFVSTDKTVYQVGDDMWFRVFLTNGFNNKISIKSYNVFVELLDERDSVVNKLLLNSKTQQLNGLFHISKHLVSGKYKIIAFTEQMSKHPEQAFGKYLMIVNPLSSLQKNTERDLKSEVKMIFYPEGGTIMSGSNSVIGYRILDDHNKPIQVQGMIKNNKDSSFINFYSDVDGIGKFEFFPSRFKKYSAHFTWKGKEMVYALPPFNFFAAQVALIQEAGVIKKAQVLLEDSIFKPFTLTYLIVVHNDSVEFASEGRGMYEINFKEHQFKPGLTTFYLFDEKQQLLSERSVYVNDPEMEVSVTTDREVYPKRAKGIISISLKDAEKKGQLATMSVSVSDSILYFPIKRSDLLTSVIDEQNKLNAWTFQESQSVNPIDLGAMMLSKKQNYLQHSAILTPYDHSHEKELLHIRGKIAGNNVETKVVSLVSTTPPIIIGTDTSKIDGSFVVPLEDYGDSTSFSVEVKSLRGKSLDDKLIVSPLLFPSINYSSIPAYDLAITDADKIAVARFYNSIAEDEISIKKPKTKETELSKKRASANSKIMTSEEMESNGIHSLDNALLTMPGVQQINGYITVQGVAGRIPGPDIEPIIIFDGNEIRQNTFDVTPGTGSAVLNFLKPINPRDIDFIELLSGPEASQYGLRGGNGVILINSKNSSSPNYLAPVKSFIANGYFRNRAFPYPDYSAEKVKDLPAEDKRTTLYFNGNILTDASGNVKVPFFTSDVLGTYRITVTGVTVHGDQFSKTVLIKVR